MTVIMVVVEVIDGDDGGRHVVRGSRGEVLVVMVMVVVRRRL